MPALSDPLLLLDQEPFCPSLRKGNNSYKKVSKHITIESNQWCASSLLMRLSLFIKIDKENTSLFYWVLT